MTHPPALLSPFLLGDLALPNRVVMAPMTRSRAGPGGVPGDLSVLYYRQRSSAGLIISEGVPISQVGVGYPRTPGLFDGTQVAGWRKVTDAVHAEGGRMFAQLWHVGRISRAEFQPGGGPPVAPSPVAARDGTAAGTAGTAYPVPRALDATGIAEVVSEFAQAARRALDAGFDGVELHAANGYLIDQFLRDGSNRREDAYGGPPAHRVRFLVEVVEAVARIVAPGRVGVRVSPSARYHDMEDSDPPTLFGTVAEVLNPFGLAYLQVVEARPGTHPSAPDPAAAPVAPHLRRLFRGAFILNGGLDRAAAEAALTTGAADLVSFGRAFISNPDLPARLAAGVPLAPADASTFYAGDERGYVDYPSAAPRAA